MNIKVEKIKLERETEPKSGFRVPIAERPVKIMQGFHGPWSHLPTKFSLRECEFVQDDSYSVDFQTPYFTLVHAAKEGVVESYVYSNRFYEGTDFEIGIGNSMTPSYVVINHGDCFSLYAHLGEFEPFIDRGYGVKQGELIGKTGRSGWVGPIPHLHFEIFQTGTSNPRLYDMIHFNSKGKKVNFPRISQPFSFEDYDGPLEHTLLHP